MEPVFAQWIGRQVRLTWTNGGQGTFVLRELGVAGAVFEDREGRVFFPWTAVVSVRLVPGHSSDSPAPGR